MKKIKGTSLINPFSAAMGETQVEGDKNNNNYYYYNWMERRTICGMFLLGMAFYLGVDPLRLSPIADYPDFKAHYIEQPAAWSDLKFGRDTHNRLQAAEIKFMNEVNGPECLVFDDEGRGPYTGIADGRIMRWDGPHIGWSEFAYTSPNWSKEVCIPKTPPCPNVAYEHLCGRPLGLRFDKLTSNLYIADAYFGLLFVGPEGGLATPLTSEAEGLPLTFTNDLDIDDEGNVYFTDSSLLYQRREFFVSIMAAEASGRVLKYNSRTNQTEVLMRGLHFPNGLSLSKDQTFIIFASCAGRLRRYWLKGPKAGTSDIFAILPGYADNVRANDEGEFWVALYCRRNAFSHVLGMYPQLRKVILRLPIPIKYQHLAFIGGKLHGIIAKYSTNGDLLDVLEDSDGKVVKAISHVEERDGKLWIGSVVMPYIATLKL